MWFWLALIHGLLLNSFVITQRQGNPAPQTWRNGPSTWKDRPHQLKSKNKKTEKSKVAIKSEFIPLRDLHLPPLQTDERENNLAELKGKEVKLGLDASKVKIFSPDSSKGCKKKRCGEVCHCIKGRSYCCRQRKDWDSLTKDEKLLYLNTVRSVAMGQSGFKLRARFRQLLQTHERYWYTAIHRRAQFLPWHRIYLLTFENILRSVDCRITIPYWDWTKKPEKWFESSVFESSHFGSNLDGFARSTKAQCPSNGFFAQKTGYTDLQGQCLSRQFLYNVVPASYSRIQSILSWENFEKFETALRYEHGIPHYMVGGDGDGLFFTMRAAEDPLFFLHHSFVDYLWYQRQNRYPETWNEFWGSRSSTKLAGLTGRVGSAINPFKHGNSNVCVEYVENDSRYRKFKGRLKSQNKFGDLRECAENNHRFPSSVFHLFKASKSEIKDFLAERNNDENC